MEPRAGFGPATYGFLSLIPSRRNDQAMLSRLSEEPGRDFRGVMYLFEGTFLIFRLIHEHVLTYSLSTTSHTLPRCITVTLFFVESYPFYCVKNVLIITFLTLTCFKS